MRKNYEEDMKNLVTKRDSLSKMILMNGYNPKEDFITKCMINIYNMCIDADQENYPYKDNECFACKRVVNIKKVLPVEELRLNHPEITVFEGLYLVVEGIAMTHKYFESNSGKYNEGLPSGYNYGTLKDCHGKYLFAISKDEPVSKYIYNSSGYDVFEL